MVKKTQEFHDNGSENISDESIGGAALIRVNTVMKSFFSLYPGTNITLLISRGLSDLRLQPFFFLEVP